jgi:hypothetical protein
MTSLPIHRIVRRVFLPHRRALVVRPHSSGRTGARFCDVQDSPLPAQQSLKVAQHLQLPCPDLSPTFMRRARPQQLANFRQRQAGLLRERDHREPGHDREDSGFTSEGCAKTQKDAARPRIMSVLPRRPQRGVATLNDRRASRCCELRCDTAPRQFDSKNRGANSRFNVHKLIRKLGTSDPSALFMSDATVEPQGVWSVCICKTIGEAAPLFTERCDVHAGGDPEEDSPHPFP